MTVAVDVMFSCLPNVILLWQYLLMWCFNVLLYLCNTCWCDVLMFPCTCAVPVDVMFSCSPVPAQYLLMRCSHVHLYLYSAGWCFHVHLSWFCQGSRDNSPLSPPPSSVYIPEVFFGCRWISGLQPPLLFTFQVCWAPFCKPFSIYEFIDIT